MTVDITGLEIVAQIAGSRPWWSLDAGDVAPWIKSLHFSAVEDHVSRTEWIGDAWDGTSAMQVGRRNIAASDIRRLLELLGRSINQLGISAIVPPDARSVRQCFVGVGAREALTIDIDMDGFILPLCIEERTLAGDEIMDWEAIAAEMARHIESVDRIRDRFLSRELRLRRAMMETVAAIGAGAAPLFLRIDPHPFNESTEHILYSSYVMLIVTLNDCLEWSPVGTERISTMKDVRDHRMWYAKTHRPRASALASMRSTQSRGSICKVTLALLEEQGLDPSDILDQARDAALRDRRGTVTIVRKDLPIEIHYRDGLLRSSFLFEGGHYMTGSLTLWGNFPDALAIGAKGRPLASYVDHPAFHAARLKVSRSQNRDGALDLHHTVGKVPIEALAPMRAVAAPSSRPSAA